MFLVSNSTGSKEAKAKKQEQSKEHTGVCRLCWLSLSPGLVSVQPTPPALGGSLKPAIQSSLARSGKLFVPLKS